MQENQGGDRSHLSRPLFLVSLHFLVFFFVVTLFLLPPAQTQNEQGASGERSSFGVTHLRIYQHSFSSYIQSLEVKMPMKTFICLLVLIQV